MLCKAGPVCKLHGGETNAFLGFCRNMLEKHKTRIENYGVFAKVADELLNIKSICDLNPEEFDLLRHPQEPLETKHRPSITNL
jgi:hypothetical protein